MCKHILGNLFVLIPQFNLQQPGRWNNRFSPERIKNVARNGAGTVAVAAVVDGQGRIPVEKFSGREGAEQRNSQCFFRYLSQTRDFNSLWSGGILLCLRQNMLNSLKAFLVAISLFQVQGGGGDHVIVTSVPDNFMNHPG